MAMEHLQTKGSFTTDIFTGEPRTLMDVVNEYKENGVAIKYTVLGIQDMSTIPVLDNRDILGWKPKYTFKQGIQSEIRRNI
jgi:nucleoside-diphosphate-sugar epimerase